MTTKEKIKIMQHYEDGGKIEIYNEYNSKVGWLETSSPIWDWMNCDYQIKQKEVIIIEKWLCDGAGRNIVIEIKKGDDMLTGWKSIKLIDTYEVEL